MKFSAEEENKEILEKLLKSKLPDENVIIITEEGYLVMDEENPLAGEELGSQVCDSILCGC